MVHQNIVSTPAQVILVRPQMQENIGATARAMANFSLSNLRLVNPREDIGDKAYAMSSGATNILEQAQYFDDTHNALADCQYVIATTARHRDLNKPVYTLTQGIEILLQKQIQGLKCGFLFGPERTGLENTDLYFADAIINVPVNPEFASLNLAQCVLLVGYEYFQQLNMQHATSSHALNSTDETTNIQKIDDVTASKAHISHLLQHLFSKLEAQNFFSSAEKRPSMEALLSNIFTRNQLTEREVGVLRGVIKALCS